jgi:hypothetical protein
MAPQEPYQAMKLRHCFAVFHSPRSSFRYGDRRTQSVFPPRLAAALQAFLGSRNELSHSAILLNKRPGEEVEHFTHE